MLNLWSRFALGSLLILFLFALSAASCEKDTLVTPEQMTAELEGEWTIISFIRGGMEYLGARIESASIVFLPADTVAGRYILRITYADTERIAVTGRYTVDARKEEILLAFDGMPVNAVAEIHDSRLSCRSRTDGYPMEIGALKRVRLGRHVKGDDAEEEDRYQR